MYPIQSIPVRRKHVLVLSLVGLFWLVFLGSTPLSVSLTFADSILHPHTHTDIAIGATQTDQLIQMPMTVGSQVDATYMISVNHEELMAAAEAEELAAATAAEKINSQSKEPNQSTQTDSTTANQDIPSQTVPMKFDILAYSTPQLALEAYAIWHKSVMSDPQLCKQAEVVVWNAAAGWGDSVNALTNSFRYAIANGRLFFVIWRAANDEAVWKRGIKEPGFQWDWNDVLHTHSHCGFSSIVLDSVRSYRRDSHPPARFVRISGSLTSDHPLAGSMEHFWSGPRNTMTSLSEAMVQDFLLQPNDELSSWIARTRKVLKSKRKKNFGAVVGMQIRTGYADAPELYHRPSNANFLAIGDEKLFLNKYLEIVDKRFDSDPTRTKVFLMTDSPLIADYMKHELQSSRGVSVVMVEDGEVAHCGPGKEVTNGGVLRMLAEWFIFKRHTDIQLITAWSLFGASSVEGKSENNIFRIDSSRCGQPGAKPCQTR